MCGYEELLAAIWGEEPRHTEMEANHLAWELCKELESNSKEPKFLETVRGREHRLVTGSWAR